MTYDPIMRGMALALATSTALAAGATACTHERPITELHGIAGKSVTVETYSHEEVQVVAIRGPDGVTFANNAGVLPPASVAKVTVVRHGQGAAEGAGIGFLIGAVIGAAIGFADGDDQCEDFCILAFSAEDKAVLGAFGIGGIGGLVGLVVGASTGSRYIYSYGDQVRVTPTGPPGSFGGVTIRY